MVSIRFRYLDKFSYQDDIFEQLLITAEWQAWETVWLFRLPSIATNPSVPVVLFESGCNIHNSTNCRKACSTKRTMFKSPETLWNCLSIAAVAAMTEGENAPHRINETESVTFMETFNPGPLNRFHKLGVLARYSRCALQSCSDPRFQGCPSELWEDKFQYVPFNLTSIEDLGRVMGEEYCAKADPGIDFDIAGPGILVAYLMQFLIVLVFAVAYKTTKTWIRNFSLAFLLPFKGPTKAVKTAIRWQNFVAKSKFSIAAGAALVDLQEAQAIFLAVVSTAAIIAFSSSSSAGLANISSSLSWLANNIILRGVVSAGMYPLLFIQLILHKTHNRWWYTLFLVILNWVLMLIITQPDVVGVESLEKHVKKTNDVNRCGGNAGPRAYCQTLNLRFRNISVGLSDDSLVSSGSLSSLGSNITSDVLGSKNGNPYLLKQNVESYFRFHSRVQAPIHTIMIFLILDWMNSVLKAQWFEPDTWLYGRVNVLIQRSPTRLQRFLEGRYFWLLTEALWISMEVLSVAMGIIGVKEFQDFLSVLQDGKEGDKSDIHISNWSFGQLVAACVWFPTILKFLCLNVGGILPSLRKRVGDMIEITYRIENERLISDVALESLIPSESIERNHTDDVETNRLTPRRSWERIDT
ncbi:hypothetical protein FPSE_10290 [Fusarium pseudograminearum CS3096]|uniref:Uncharacterized protein n=1 Tax=Fusarium pseudograminearum (strain CS3096) TaxID=1028729 RepID=K3V8E8_FUSPC|nr:hypothetical protein FPSE_10290 [Fusarium pseudograminearum CS3096]EKJ69579.1 hypothetical protein FPSE_10290 [Fusarium pseudograminearum CS3096]